jgi:hypothetical protein
MSIPQGRVVPVVCHL